MRKVFLIPLAFTAGCASLPATSWTLPTGETVTCGGFHQEECGLQLSGCGEEKAVDFCLSTDVMFKGTPGGEK